MRLKLWAGAAGVAWCLLVLPVAAGQLEDAAGQLEDALDLEDAAAAYGRGEYETAISLWKPLAEQGNASAQNNLGLMDAKGQGVPQDYVQGHMWLNLSAAGGDASSIKN